MLTRFLWFAFGNLILDTNVGIELVIIGDKHGQYASYVLLCEIDGFDWQGIQSVRMFLIQNVLGCGRYRP